MDMKKRIHLELRNRTPSDVSNAEDHISEVSCVCVCVRGAHGCKALQKVTLHAGFRRC